MELITDEHGRVTTAVAMHEGENVELLKPLIDAGLYVPAAADEPRHPSITKDEWTSEELQQQFYEEPLSKPSGA